MRLKEIRAMCRASRLIYFFLVIFLFLTHWSVNVKWCLNRHSWEVSKALSQSQIKMDATIICPYDIWLEESFFRCYFAVQEYSTEGNQNFSNPGAIYAWFLLCCIYFSSKIDGLAMVGSFWNTIPDYNKKNGDRLHCWDEAGSMTPRPYPLLIHTVVEASSRADSPY